MTPIPLAHASARLPVSGVVITEFDPPDHPWLPGHRGVDIAAPEGSEVTATASGRVAWVGTIGSVTSVSVELPDGRRYTFQPVEPTVVVGQRVRAGDTIGRLAASDHCPTTCLHWGLKRDDQYFDPRVSDIRLLPATARPRQRVAPPPPPGVRSEAGLPVAGPITSRFGMRVHPVTGIYKLHDGVDIGAACGSPVVAPRPGKVVAAYTNVAWGHRVVIDHGVVRGRRLSTTYNHLESLPPLRIGTALAAGSLVGRVGSTGYSTGCHLHWGLLIDGKPVDPLAG